MNKTIVEWVSRILWLLGALFALTACVCLMIAFAKTEVNYNNSTYYLAQNGYVFLQLPSNLYRAVGYDVICAFFCFLVAKVLHWLSTKAE